MRTLRVLCVPLALLGLFFFSGLGESGCGKCTAGNASSYPSCQVNDNYAGSPQCSTAQVCVPLVPGSLTDTRCLTSCPHGTGCGASEYCQPVGVGNGCGKIILDDAGVVDSGCMTVYACEPVTCQ